MIRPSITLGLGLVLGSLGWAQTAAAWEPISGSQPVWPGTVTWSLHQAGSADLPFATVEADVRRGMEDWSRVSCSSLTTHYEGTTSQMPVSGDGQGIIAWFESGWGHSSSAIGVTGSRFTSGTIVEADMEMNGVHFTWTTAAGSGGNVNLYSIALHEGGHWMGLGHSSVSSASMYFAYSGGIGAIGADDEAGICALYPGAGGGPSDCTTTGCPSGQECVAGSCEPVGGGPGEGETCASCTTHGECGSGNYCLGYPDGQGYCGTACGNDADCGGSDRCVTLSNGARQCVRYAGDAPSCAGGGVPLPGECTSDSDCDSGQRCDGGACVPQATGGAPTGEACTAHGDCASGACMAGVCTQTCDWPSGACPDGFFCDGGATGACGPGVCMAGRAGAGRVGDSCDGHTECEGLFCSDGRCAEACIPGELGACDDGLVCAVAGLSCRGACGTTGSLGDPCAGNEACASGLCASHGANSFCTALCDASSPCGPGFRCAEEGAVAVCVPDGGALGSDCADNGDCASGICAHEEGRSYCTRICDTAAPCVAAMACVESGTEGISVCQPQTSTGGGNMGRPGAVTGCAIGAGSRSTPTLLLFGLALCLAARGRRVRS